MEKRTRICAVDDCDRVAEARGWCGRHYQRWVKYGDPSHPVKPNGQDKRHYTPPSVRYLKPGEPVPTGTPKRYTNVHGYVILRWRVAPRTYVETLEHRVVDGRVTEAANVHHRDHDKRNNDPANLLHTDKNTHAKSHESVPRILAAELYAKGMTTIEIAELLGTHPGNISRKVRAEGVPTRRGVDARSRGVKLTVNPFEFAAMVELARELYAQRLERGGD